MKMTNKEIEQAEKKAEEFFESISGMEIGVVGLTILFIAGSFIIDIAEDKESALEGLKSFTMDIESAISEAFYTIN